MKNRTVRLTLCAGLLCLTLMGTAAGILPSDGTASMGISRDGSVAAVSGAGLQSSAAA